jgi:hypothetical protein
MGPNRQRIQQYLAAFQFKSLFVEELGWEILHEAALHIAVENHTYTLQPLVEKRSVKIYVCSPDAQGNIPDACTMSVISLD